MVVGVTRDKQKPFRVRRISTMLLGRGKGKEETIERLFLNDVSQRRKTVLIADSKTVKRIAPFLPKRNIQLFEPSKRTFPFNILANVKHRSLLADHLIEIVRGGRADIATTRIDLFVRTAVLALLSFPNGNLTQLRQLLTDAEFRASVTTLIDDTELKDIWTEYDTMTPKEKRDRTESTVSRLVSFTLDPRIRQSLGHKDNALGADCIIVSLDDKELGANAWLIGQLVMAWLDIQAVGGNVYTLYVPHGERFPFLRTLVERGTVPTFFTVESLALLKEKGMESVVPQLLAFRTTVADADALEPEFRLKHGQTKLNLVEIPDHHAYMVHGMNAIELLTFEHSHPRQKYGSILLKEGKLCGRS